MKLGVLDNPVRATWDLQGDGYQMAEADVALVLQRLTDARLFFVTLAETPALHPQFREILATLAGNGTQVTVFTSGNEAEISVLASCVERPAEVLLQLDDILSASDPGFTVIHERVAALREINIDPGLSLTPLRGNIEFFIPLFELCNKLKIPRFKLPNVRIDDNFQAIEAAVLRPDDLEAFRKNLHGFQPDSEACRLEIHDLFLWEVLTPGNADSRTEYGGCQAANSLAHIRSDGVVWPCVTWPEPLGSLLTKSFSEIWEAGPCQEIRRQIAMKPDGCHDCHDYRICFGGCRGLAKMLDVEGGIDPMCKGSR